MTTAAGIRVYPIKSLDGVAVASATVGSDGGFVRDRQLALVDRDGDYVNGKRTAAVHRIDATFDLDERVVTLDVPRETDETSVENGDPGVSRVVDPATGSDTPPLPTDDPPERATIPLAAYDRLGEWFTAYFGYEVSVVSAAASYPDDTDAPGPTVVSTATLRTVTDWFDLPTENVRRRFRANLEFDDCEPFFEDRLYGRRSEHVAFTVGDATFHGEGPCRRCVVPSRDPDTGRGIDQFTDRFVRRRRETLPAWSDGERFDGAFRLAVNTLVPPDTRGQRVAVGDSLTGRQPVPVE
jgi:Uncharacterized Fe-S protein